jgi:hypothetical protein
MHRRSDENQLHSVADGFLITALVHSLLSVSWRKAQQ